MTDKETAPQEPPQAPKVDLEELARLLFELLRRELQLENERLGR